jgi:hypothetical protein
MVWKRGIVGAYNTIRGFGLKFGLKLAKAETLSGKRADQSFERLVLPPLKFVITGSGKVGEYQGNFGCYEDQGSFY